MYLEHTELVKSCLIYIYVCVCVCVCIYVCTNSLYLACFRKLFVKITAYSSCFLVDGSCLVGKIVYCDIFSFNMTDFYPEF